ncbi:hypothetical protein CW707_00170 [Candidatus Bathyarchaeota archaeon]|nr:MAG: hypothetical protein CW667_03115 [Candidatus Bathyarchaeota archaeon]RJS82721.1 MAG: hypothetical protein CW707_00170 [Candidatus Bathyarchaeota archaeon]RLI18567.1 MAG: hypothetical protein DRO44_00820 [Candidatus Bathyarchaeota archaeon]HDD70015.1 hypothetical protein [Candidatus Bathyarchaeota archaeon]
MKTWLDIAVLRCPHCGHYYVDASWYVIEMESDIQCGRCKKEFNSRKNATDRILLECQIDENGKLQNVKIAKTLKLDELSGN